MSDVLDVLGEAGPFRAFSSGDAGENNFLWDGSDGRLIDFEFAGFQHALLDGACLHIVHPRWIAFPDPAAAGLEATYRSALSEGITEAEDDRTWNRAMGAAVMARTLASLGRRIPRVGLRPPGDSSRAQMITIFEFAARAARQYRVLSALTSLCDELAETLRRRWPDARERLEGLHGREAEWIRR
jgi:Phosphotransferase enzyme family